MGIMGEMELVCRALKALYMWLVRSETPTGIFDSYIQFQGLKEVVNMKQTIYDLYRWVMHSKNTILASSLSVIGAGHPFIPSDSPLCQAFSGNMADKCWIVGHMNSNQGWSPQIFKVRIGGLSFRTVFSSDGCRLAAASSDGIVRVWDAATGAPLRELKGPDSPVLSVAFSPDGRHLASSSADPAVRLWDVATGALLQELKGHKGVVRCVVFSPDGRHLASASNDYTVHVWDAVTGVSLQELTGHSAWVQCVAFSPDSRHLASGSCDSTVRIWDAVTGLSLHILKGHTVDVWSIAFSPNGRNLASASIDQTVQVWDVATGRILRALRGYTVAYSPDGHHLASTLPGYTVCIWDATKGTPLQELWGHTGFVRSVAFSSDGRHLASVSFDQTLRTRDAATRVPFRGVPKHTDAVDFIMFSPDGSHLVSTSKDCTVQVWDVGNGRSVVQRMLNIARYPHNVSFSHDGTMLSFQSQYLQTTLYLHFPSLETITTPPTPVHAHLPQNHPSVYLDQNSLCIKRKNVTLHICWLPDSFEPTTPVAQHGNHVCVGGKEGQIAFINLKGLQIPDL